MSASEFIIVWIACLATMLLCRCIPIFVLQGRDLPENLQMALNLIPPAAFAALVASDLFNPQNFTAGVASNLIPLVAAGAVLAVALKTRSLIWCVVTGVACYALLAFL